MFYPRNPIIFPPKLAGSFCRAWGAHRSAHISTTTKKEFHSPIPYQGPPREKCIDIPPQSFLKTNIYNMQITRTLYATSLEEVVLPPKYGLFVTGLSRLVNDQKICPIGLVRRAGGDGKALRLDSLQSTVLAELIRKELRRLRDFEFQGHVHFTSTCSTGFLPVNFQAALGQMQPNTILTLPSNGGLIDINKYIYDTNSEYHCQTSMTPRCASKLTTK